MARQVNGVSAPQTYTAEALAAMSPDQRNAILASMSPAQRSALSGQLAQLVGVANVRFMQQSIPQIAVCPTDANGLSATYTLGQTLSWTLPQQPNGFATELLFDVSLTPTYVANGTSPYFDKNASWPYSFFSRLQVIVNDSQIDLPFYVVPLLHNFTRYDRTNMGYVDADYTDSSVQSQVWSDAMPTGNLVFRVHVPLNRIHDYAVAGALPMSGITRPQIRLTCASSINGVDPALAPVTTNATTWSVAGTVTMKVKYLDGLNYLSPSVLPLDLTVEPTIQMMQDSVLQPMVGGLRNMLGMKTRLQHYYVFAIVIDGNQSNQYSAWSNIASFGLYRDYNGNNPFFYYGDNDNTTIYDYLSQTRNKFGRDIQTQGVIPLITAPETGIANISNRDGFGILNMDLTQPNANSAGAWAATYLAVKPSTVGSVSGIVPRIEIYVVSLNNQGLKFV